MALPHGESAKLANEIPNAKIIDLSADFRLGDEEAWHQFYGADVAYAGRWAYGLPELPGAKEQDQGRPHRRRPRLLRHHVHPRARARCCTRAWSSRTTS